MRSLERAPTHARCGTRTSAPPVDLFVGGRLGAWAMRYADPAQVRRIVCLDAQLALFGEGADIPVFCGDPHAAPALEPADTLIVVGFPKLVRPEISERYPHGAYAVHPGLLPWGRGVEPVFWALYEGSPAGATLYELTGALHRGPVIEQVPVPVLASDTGPVLAARVEAAQLDLLDRWLPRLAAGERPPSLPQPPHTGSYHTRAEFEATVVGAANDPVLSRCLP